MTTKIVRCLRPLPHIYWYFDVGDHLREVAPFILHNSVLQILCGHNPAGNATQLR